MLSRLKAMFLKRRRKPDTALSWQLTKAALERAMSDNRDVKRLGMAQLDVLSTSALTNDLDKSIAADAVELLKRERK